MKEKYIVDLYKKRVYGPYTNKSKMKRDLTKIKIVSDMFLGNESTNVLVIPPENLELFLEYRKEN